MIYNKVPTRVDQLKPGSKIESLSRWFKVISVVPDSGDFYRVVAAEGSASRLIVRLDKNVVVNVQGDIA